MVKKLIVLLMLIQPMFAWAESHNDVAIDDSDEQKPIMEITMSPVDAVKIAGNLVHNGKYNGALQILTKMPQTGQNEVEIERWYLIAQIEQRRGNIDEAIKIYRKMLDEQPDLVKVRYELAQCYMLQKKWYRADYHLRLAMAGDDIPEPVKKNMMYYRYLVRQNKNWNVWFNFGAAPDSNINQVAGGEECITNEWGVFCRQLPEPISAVGYNLTLGGNYEFKFGEHWRWKNDATLYSSVYRTHDYDDLYIGASTGPRYVWHNGDIWLAAIGSRRLYGWDGYNWAYGGKLDGNFDLTRKLGIGATTSVTHGIYDEYGDYMNGMTYSFNPRISYSIDATKYLILRGGLSREYTASDIYKNWRYSTSLGFGSELPWGFHVYLEPSFSWTNYDGPRWAVKDGDFTQITERDFTQRYSVSVSNNKFDIWGFVPTLTFSYTNRDSNIKNRGYDKMSVEFNMQQRF